MAKNDVVPDEEKTPEQLAEERRRYREQKREQAWRILIVLTLISLALFLISLTYEGALFSRQARYPGDVSSVKRVAKVRKPPVARLYTLFPPDITAYATKARHNTPYSDGLQAEAIYESEDMALQLATPMTVYCLLTAWESDDEAMKDIEKTSREYHLESGSKTVGQTPVLVTVGYNQERGRYFVGYQKGSLSLKISAVYTMVVPAAKNDDLKRHGERVAQEVINHLSLGLVSEE